MAQVTRNLSAIKFGYVESAHPSSVVDISSKTDVILSRKPDKTIINFLYVGFEAWPSNLKNNRLYSASALFSIETYRSIYPNAGLEASSGDFNPATLMWSNRPVRIGNYWMISEDATGRGNKGFSMSGDAITDQQRSEFAYQLLSTNTAILFCSSYGQNTQQTSGNISVQIYKKLTNDVNAPYLTITYDDTIKVKSKITPQNSPAGGYVDPRTPTTFTWTFEKDETDPYFCVGGFSQQSATLFWKTTTEENWHQVQASGSTQSLTVPGSAANPTFTPGAEIQWYLSGTDTSGTTSTSETFTFTTVAAPVVVNPVAPVSSLEDGSNDLTFRWTYSTTDGFPPSKVTLQWRRSDEASWTPLLTEADWIESYTMPANTLPAAEIQWRVLGYNIDGVAGEYATANFVAIAAPIVLNVTATEVPYSTIRWQVENQVAYQIVVDEITYGSYFGSEKAFTLPEPLSDGLHRIKVRTMGGYGLWSEWLETSVTITNIPGDEILLTGTADLDAVLNWEHAEEPNAQGDYYIYRDNAPIGHTLSHAFTDRFASGEHIYHVINKLADGYYTKSNAITLQIIFNDSFIALASGGDWVPIRLSTEENRGPNYTDTRQTTFNHMAGDAYPSAVISNFRDQTLNYSVAFPARNEDQHAAFRAMFGKPVVMKLSDGSVFVGVLASWTKTSRIGFYFSYSFSIRRIEWEEFFDDNS